jgi:hypothetical protein
VQCRPAKAAGVSIKRVDINFFHMLQNLVPFCACISEHRSAKRSNSMFYGDREQKFVQFDVFIKEWN